MQPLIPQKLPEDTEVPPINPIGTYETRTGPDGMPFPVLDETRPGAEQLGALATS